MGDLSIDQIKLKAYQARDLFNTYIDNLVNAGETRKASDAEIDLFNLGTFYIDNRLSQTEANQLKSRVNNINLGTLIDDKSVTYNQQEKRFRSNGGSGDLNVDDTIDAKDLNALNFLLNFKGDPFASLENILEIAGDKDKITELYVKNWAFERGLQTGTQQYTNFYNKFYNQLYKGSTPKLEVSLLQSFLRLYDIGLGKSNINDIDAYKSVVLTETPLNIIINLYKFENSDSFDVPNDQKAAKRNSYIAMLSGENQDLKQILSEALTRRSVPISGKELKVSNLDPILALYQIGNKKERDIAINTLQINQEADRRNLNSGTKPTKEEFVTKFINYSKPISEEDQGLRVDQLKPLFNIYDDMKIDYDAYVKNNGLSGNPPAFSFEKIDVYKDGVKQLVSSKSLSMIYQFEKSEIFDSLKNNPTRRAEKINEYFGLILNSNKQISNLFTQAITSRKIPFTQESLSLEKLDKFISEIKEEDGILDKSIKNLAEQRELENDREFISLIKGFVKIDKIPLEQVKTLLGFYDKAKKENKNFPYKNLVEYKDGIKENIPLKKLASLFKFELGSGLFSDPARKNKIKSYIETLAGKDSKTTDSAKQKQKQELLEKSLGNGKEVYLTGLELNETNLNTALTNIDATNGYELLRINNIVDKTKTNNKIELLNKIKEWHLKQIDPTKTNYEIPLEAVTEILKFYDDEKLSPEKRLNLNDLDIYAKAVGEKVLYKNLKSIYKFETDNSFKSLGERKRKNLINSYLDILKSENKEKGGRLLNSFKTGKFPVTEEKMKEDTESVISEANLNRLGELLNKFDRNDKTNPPDLALAELFLDTWSSKPGYNINFKTKFLNDYFLDTGNKGFKLTISELTSLNKLYETNPNFDLEKLDSYAKGIKLKTPFNDILRLYKLEANPNFRGSKEQIDRYIEILANGPKNKKSILQDALKRNNIQYLNKKLITENNIDLAELDRVLNLANDQTQLNNFIIGSWAIKSGFDEGSNGYTEYLRKFKTDYLEAKKLNMGDLKILDDIYNIRETNQSQRNNNGRRIYEFTTIDKFANAIANNVSSNDIKKYEKFARTKNLNVTQFDKYLNILIGTEGQEKQKIVLEMIRTNRVPYSNLNF
jgi:hypothetical protein